MNAPVRPLPLLALALLTAACSPREGCRRLRRYHRRATATSLRGERIAIPAAVPAPGTHDTALEADIPLAWIHLPEDPVPTGSAPQAIVGGAMPCGFTPMLATVSAPGTPLRVRLRAHFTGPGAPGDPCVARPFAVQFVSLQRLRLGTYAVTDATPHGPTDPPVPSVDLHVVPDDVQLPPPMVRQMRRCNPSHAGDCPDGRCGYAPSQPSVGVCVPFLDPFLAAHAPCPANTKRGTLFVRDGEIVTDLAACLPSCDEGGPCPAPLACVTVGGMDACLPH